MAPLSPKLRALLLRYYHRLSLHFGPQRWWPGRTRFEVILGALLAQNTSWKNVEKALSNLRREKRLSAAGLNRLHPSRLQALLRPSGTYKQKTRTVRAFLRHLNSRYQGSLVRLLGRPTQPLRQELLSLRGIGPETADAILLYAGKRPVFVVDSYARRVLSRHGLAERSASYPEVQEFLQKNLPRDPVLFNEYHALLVAVGKAYCDARQPDCRACPLGPELEGQRAPA